MTLRKALAHMKIGDKINSIQDRDEAMLEKQRDNYALAFEEFKRLYLTEKTLSSYHDYVYSFEKMIQTTLVPVYKSYQDKKNKKVDSYRLLNEDEKKEALRFKYDEGSGFLLFKEFVNQYYNFIPDFGFDSHKIRQRVAYLNQAVNQDGVKDPKHFTALFKTFLRQINDNSFEDLSMKRTHLRSYDTFEPRNAYLKLKHTQYNMEQVDIQSTILSDSLEFILN